MSRSDPEGSPLATVTSTRDVFSFPLLHPFSPFSTQPLGDLHLIIRELNKTQAAEFDPAYLRAFKECQV